MSPFGPRKIVYKIVDWGRAALVIGESLGLINETEVREVSLELSAGRD